MTNTEADESGHALRDTAALAAALGGGMAMVRLEEPAGGLEVIDGLPPALQSQARSLAERSLNEEVPVKDNGLVCVAAVTVPRFRVPGRQGWIAVFRPDVAATDEPAPAGAGLRGHLETLALALARQHELILRDARMTRIAVLLPGVLYQLRQLPDGRIRIPYASEGLKEVYRMAPEDVVGDATAALRMNHPDDRPRLIASLDRSAQDLTPWESEYRVRFDDGTVHWLHGRAMPERLDDGGTLWHGFVMPIDKRKRAEQALARSEESFRHFFEAGLVGMTIATPGRNWLTFNRRMAEMLGYTAKEMQSLDWAMFTHPDDLSADEAQYARMVAGEIDGYVMDKRYLKKDGSVLECALAVRCEREDDGGLRRVFAIVVDIDERRRAERALQSERDGLEQQVAVRTRQLVAARDEAQAANRAKTEFLASMSHELRTPLNAILGFAQLIQLDQALGERSRRQVDEVVHAGRHLLRLISEVLDLAQVESGRMTFSPETLELHEVVHEAAALTDALGRARHLRLTIRVPEALSVRADRTRVKQVLVNLLSNAAKYSPEGSRVDVEASANAQDRVRIVVGDQGPGIPLERQAELFQPFSRLGAEFGSVEGTGIGLALCRRLLSLMGGDIGVVSALGEGSRFWIELPGADRTSAPAMPPSGPTD